MQRRQRRSVAQALKQPRKERPLDEIAHHQAKAFATQRGFERFGRGERAVERGHTFANQAGQRFRSRGALHAMTDPHQQRIVEKLPQARQRIAHRRLRQPQAIGRPTHAAFLQQHVERHEKVRVDLTNIHSADNTISFNPLVKYALRTHGVRNEARTTLKEASGGTMNDYQTTEDSARTDRRFTDKTVIITGGGTGIGRAAAERFLAEGARVVLNGRREDVLAETAAALDPSGERVAFVASDIGYPETAVRLVETASARFGGVDVLINNAGIFSPKPFVEHTEADFDRFVRTILKGKFFMAQAAAKAMIARGGGAIVHTGSMWAEHAVKATPSSAYSAANAGVHALVRNLALELAPHIRINAVAPAVVDTPVYETFIPAHEVKGVLAGFDAFHPLGRIGRPNDVVGAIAFVASEEASWITGAVLPVDGGVLAGR